jgi:hypothetical protein
MRAQLVAAVAILMALVSLALYMNLHLRSFFYFFIGVLITVAAAALSVPAPYDTMAAGIAVLALGWALARAATIDRYRINFLRILLSREATNTALQELSQKPRAPASRDIRRSCVILVVVGLAFLYLDTRQSLIIYVPFVFAIQLLAAYCFFFRVHRNHSVQEGDEDIL